MSQDDVNRQAFTEEANDLLAELETALLELEEQPEDRELIDRVFRAMHTIKGSGAMFGFDDIAAFTHDVETVFDKVRNGELGVTKELLDLTLRARDHIKALLQSAETGEPVDTANSQSIITGLRGLTGAAQPEAAQDEQPAQSAEGPSGDDDVVTYRVRFKPDSGIFMSGTNPLALLEELAELGRSKIIAHTGKTPPLDEMDPESCLTWWDVILTTTGGENAIRDVFIFVEDDCELDIQVIDSFGSLDSDEAYKKLGEILVERGDLSADILRKLLEEQRKLGEILTKSGAVTEEQVRSALAEQNAVREVRTERQKTEAASSIRVGADKLDYLVDLVGELVIVQAQITQVVGEKADPELQPLAEELERLSDELRDSTLSVRMLPIGSTFSKFRRLVRDLSAELGKQIDLKTQGAETELDKTVIERLNDPLVHLLRNSIDHGVEMPSERSLAGKPPTGTIVLSAEHSGGEVLIRIVDDGHGMDPQALKAKGRGAGHRGPRRRAHGQGMLQPHLRGRLLHGRQGDQRLRPRRGHGRGQAGHRFPARDHRRGQQAGQGDHHHRQAAPDPGHHRRSPGARGGRLFRPAPVPGGGMRGAHRQGQGRDSSGAQPARRGGALYPAAGTGSPSTAPRPAHRNRWWSPGVEGKPRRHRRGQRHRRASDGHSSRWVRVYRDVEGLSGATIKGDGSPGAHPGRGPGWCVSVVESV